MITYENADQSTYDLLKEIGDTYHNIPTNTKIGILFVYDIDKEGNISEKPPLKNQGFAAAAKIGVVKLKDRITKNLDVEIEIDGEFWKHIDEKTKRAILDHELEHLEYKDQEDDLGRPKFKLKRDEFCVWGFLSIIERHGDAAPELQNFNSLRDKILQITK